MAMALESSVALTVESGSLIPSLLPAGWSGLACPFSFSAQGTSIAAVALRVAWLAGLPRPGPVQSTADGRGSQNRGETLPVLSVLVRVRENRLGKKKELRENSGTLQCCFATQGQSSSGQGRLVVTWAELGRQVR